MQLSPLGVVFDQDGGAATVYLEARSPSEDAAAQIQLRWRDLADQLRRAGADDKAIAAIESALDSGEYGWQQGSGRVLVASSAGLLFDEPLDAAQGAGDETYWSHLPRLGRFLREQAQTCRQLLVLADQQGATVRELVVSPERGSHTLDAGDVAGRSPGQVHKPRASGPGNRRIQNRAEEAAFRQADEVIDHVQKVASRFQPAVVVLAGEVQGREAIRAELPPGLQELVVETEHGGRAAGASEEPLEDALCAIATETARRQGNDTLERLRDQQPYGRGTEGLQHTAQAAQTTAVETLILEHERDVDGELWIGPSPEHIAVDADTLRDLDVSEPVRVDAESALIRCCANTGAGLQVVPNGADLTDGVAAALRFDPGL